MHSLVPVCGHINAQTERLRPLTTFNLPWCYGTMLSTEGLPALACMHSSQLRELLQNAPLVLRQHVRHLHADLKAVAAPHALGTVGETLRHAGILKHQRRPVLGACTDNRCLLRAAVSADLGTIRSAIIPSLVLQNPACISCELQAKTLPKLEGLTCR